MPRQAKRKVHPHSLANLKQYNGAGSNTHSAHSQVAVRPLREKHLADLAAEFPNASRRRLVIQAHRLGQLELLGAFTDERGVIRHRRRGDVFPAATLAEKIATAYLAEHDRLEAQERAHSTPNPAQALAAIVAADTDHNDGDQHDDTA
jgi:hypothetical protein